MNLGSLVVKFPGLVYPTKAPISAAGLIGYLEQELKAHPQYETLAKMAEASLPKPKEQH